MNLLLSVASAPFNRRFQLLAYFGGEGKSEKNFLHAAAGLDFCRKNLNIGGDYPANAKFKIGEITMPDKKSFHEAEYSQQEAAADKRAETPNETAPQAEGAALSAGDVIEKLNAENAELKNRLMLLAADMENLRKRTARDIADAKTYAVSAFARDMLSVADNLERALTALPAEAAKEDARLKSLAEGVEMTGRAMMAALQSHGVRKIEALGQKFDPNLHQAIFEAEDKSVPHNTVNQELQPGYSIGGRVLRAAQVGIAKGGEKPDSEPQKPQEH